MCIINPLCTEKTKQMKHQNDLKGVSEGFNNNNNIYRFVL